MKDIDKHELKKENLNQWYQKCKETWSDTQKESENVRQYLETYTQHWQNMEKMILQIEEWLKSNQGALSLRQKDNLGDKSTTLKELKQLVSVISEQSTVETQKSLRQRLAGMEQSFSRLSQKSASDVSNLRRDYNKKVADLKRYLEKSESLLRLPIKSKNEAIEEYIELLANVIFSSKNVKEDFQNISKMGQHFTKHCSKSETEQMLGELRIQKARLIGLMEDVPKTKGKVTELLKNFTKSIQLTDSVQGWIREWENKLAELISSDQDSNTDYLSEIKKCTNTISSMENSLDKSEVFIQLIEALGVPNFSTEFLKSAVKKAREDLESLPQFAESVRVSLSTEAEPKESPRLMQWSEQAEQAVRDILGGQEPIEAATVIELLIRDRDSLTAASSSSEQGRRFGVASAALDGVRQYPAYRQAESECVAAIRAAERQLEREDNGRDVQAMLAEHEHRFGTGQFRLETEAALERMRSVAGRLMESAQIRGSYETLEEQCGLLADRINHVEQELCARMQHNCERQHKLSQLTVWISNFANVSNLVAAPSIDPGCSAEQYDSVLHTFAELCPQFESVRESVEQLAAATATDVQDGEMRAAVDDVQRLQPRVELLSKGRNVVEALRLRERTELNTNRLQNLREQLVELRRASSSPETEEHLRAKLRQQERVVEQIGALQQGILRDMTSELDKLEYKDEQVAAMIRPTLSSLQEICQQTQQESRVIYNDNVDFVEAKCHIQHQLEEIDCHLNQLETSAEDLPNVNEPIQVLETKLKDLDDSRNKLVKHLGTELETEIVQTMTQKEQKFEQLKNQIGLKIRKKKVTDILKECISNLETTEEDIKSIKSKNKLYPECFEEILNLKNITHESIESGEIELGSEIENIVVRFSDLSKAETIDISNPTLNSMANSVMEIQQKFVTLQQTFSKLENTKNLLCLSQKCCALICEINLHKYTVPNLISKPLSNNIQQNFNMVTVHDQLVEMLTDMDAVKQQYELITNELDSFDKHISEIEFRSQTPDENIVKESINMIRKRTSIKDSFESIPLLQQANEKFKISSDSFVKKLHNYIEEEVEAENQFLNNISMQIYSELSDSSIENCNTIFENLKVFYQELDNVQSKGTYFEGLIDLIEPQKSQEKSRRKNDKVLIDCVEIQEQCKKKLEVVQHCLELSKKLSSHLSCTRNLHKPDSKAPENLRSFLNEIRSIKSGIEVLSEDVQKIGVRLKENDIDMENEILAKYSTVWKNICEKEEAVKDKLNLIETIENKQEQTGNDLKHIYKEVERILFDVADNEVLSSDIVEIEKFKVQVEGIKKEMAEYKSDLMSTSLSDSNANLLNRTEILVEEQLRIARKQQAILNEGEALCEFDLNVIEDQSELPDPETIQSAIEKLKKLKDDMQFMKDKIKDHFPKSNKMKLSKFEAKESDIEKQIATFKRGSETVEKLIGIEEDFEETCQDIEMDLMSIEKGQNSQIEVALEKLKKLKNKVELSLKLIPIEIEAHPSFYDDAIAKKKKSLEGIMRNCLSNTKKKANDYQTIVSNIEAVMEKSKKLEEELQILSNEDLSVINRQVAKLKEEELKNVSDKLDRLNEEWNQIFEKEKLCDIRGVTHSLMKQNRVIKDLQSKIVARQREINNFAAENQENMEKLKDDSRRILETILDDVKNKDCRVSEEEIENGLKKVDENMKEISALREMIKDRLGEESKEEKENKYINDMKTKLAVTFKENEQLNRKNKSEVSNIAANVSTAKEGASEEDLESLTKRKHQIEKLKQSLRDIDVSSTTPGLVSSRHVTKYKLDVEEELDRLCDAVDMEIYELKEDEAAKRQLNEELNSIENRHAQLNRALQNPEGVISLKDARKELCTLVDEIEKAEDKSMNIRDRSYRDEVKKKIEELKESIHDIGDAMSKVEGHLEIEQTIVANCKATLLDRGVQSLQGAQSLEEFLEKEEVVELALERIRSANESIQRSESNNTPICSIEVKKAADKKLKYSQKTTEMINRIDQIKASIEVEKLRKSQLNCIDKLKEEVARLEQSLTSSDEATLLPHLKLKEIWKSIEKEALQYKREWEADEKTDTDNLGMLGTLINNLIDLEANIDDTHTQIKLDEKVVQKSEILLKEIENNLQSLNNKTTEEKIELLQEQISILHCLQLPDQNSYGVYCTEGQIIEGKVRLINDSVLKLSKDLSVKLDEEIIKHKCKEMLSRIEECVAKQETNNFDNFVSRIKSENDQIIELKENIEKKKILEPDERKIILVPTDVVSNKLKDLTDLVNQTKKIVENCREVKDKVENKYLQMLPTVSGLDKISTVDGLEKDLLEQCDSLIECNNQLKQDPFIQTSDVQSLRDKNNELIDRLKMIILEVKTQRERLIAAENVRKGAERILEELETAVEELNAIYELREKKANLAKHDVHSQIAMVNDLITTLDKFVHKNEKIFKTNEKGKITERFEKMKTSRNQLIEEISLQISEIDGACYLANAIFLRHTPLEQIEELNEDQITDHVEKMQAEIAQLENARAKLKRQSLNMSEKNEMISEIDSKLSAMQQQILALTKQKDYLGNRAEAEQQLENAKAKILEQVNQFYASLTGDENRISVAEIDGRLSQLQVNCAAIKQPHVITNDEYENTLEEVRKKVQMCQNDYEKLKETKSDLDKEINEFETKQFQFLEEAKVPSSTDFVEKYNKYGELICDMNTLEEPLSRIEEKYDRLLTHLNCQDMRVDREKIAKMKTTTVTAVREWEKIQEKMKAELSSKLDLEKQKEDIWIQECVNNLHNAQKLDEVVVNHIEDKLQELDTIATYIKEGEDLIENIRVLEEQARFIDPDLVKEGDQDDQRYVDRKRSVVNYQEMVEESRRQFEELSGKLRQCSELCDRMDCSTEAVKERLAVMGTGDCGNNRVEWLRKVEVLEAQKRMLQQLEPNVRQLQTLETDIRELETASVSWQQSRDQQRPEAPYARAVVETHNRYLSCREDVEDAEAEAQAVLASHEQLLSQLADCKTVTETALLAAKSVIEGFSEDRLAHAAVAYQELRSMLLPKVADIEGLMEQCLTVWNGAKDDKAYSDGSDIRESITKGLQKADQMIELTKQRQIKMEQQKNNHKNLIQKLKQLKKESNKLLKVSDLKNTTGMDDVDNNRKKCQILRKKLFDYKQQLSELLNEIADTFDVNKDQGKSLSDAIENNLRKAEVKFQIKSDIKQSRDKLAYFSSHMQHILTPIEEESEDEEAVLVKGLDDLKALEDELEESETSEASETSELESEDQTIVAASKAAMRKEADMLEDLRKSHVEHLTEQLKRVRQAKSVRVKVLLWVSELDMESLELLQQADGKLVEIEELRSLVGRESELDGILDSAEMKVREKKSILESVAWLQAELREVDEQLRSSAMATSSEEPSTAEPGVQPADAVQDRLRAMTAEYDHIAESPELARHAAVLVEICDGIELQSRMLAELKQKQLEMERCRLSSRPSTEGPSFTESAPHEHEGEEDETVAPSLDMETSLKTEQSNQKQGANSGLIVQNSQSQLYSIPSGVTVQDISQSLEDFQTELEANMKWHDLDSLNPEIQTLLDKVITKQVELKDLITSDCRLGSCGDVTKLTKDLSVFHSRLLEAQRQVGETVEMNAELQLEAMECLVWLTRADAEVEVAVVSASQLQSERTRLAQFEEGRLRQLTERQKQLLDRRELLVDNCGLETRIIGLVEPVHVALTLLLHKINENEKVAPLRELETCLSEAALFVDGKFPVWYKQQIQTTITSSRECMRRITETTLQLTSVERLTEKLNRHLSATGVNWPQIMLPTARSSSKEQTASNRAHRCRFQSFSSAVSDQLRPLAADFQHVGNSIVDISASLYKWIEILEDLKQKWQDLSANQDQFQEWMADMSSKNDLLDEGQMNILSDNSIKEKINTLLSLKHEIEHNSLRLVDMLIRDDRVTTLTLSPELNSGEELRHTDTLSDRLNGQYLCLLEGINLQVERWRNIARQLDSYQRSADDLQHDYNRVLERLEQQQQQLWTNSASSTPAIAASAIPDHWEFLKSPHSTVSEEDRPTTGGQHRCYLRNSGSTHGLSTRLWPYSAVTSHASGLCHTNRSITSLACVSPRPSTPIGSSFIEAALADSQKKRCMSSTDLATTGSTTVRLVPDQSVKSLKQFNTVSSGYRSNTSSNISTYRF